MTRVAVLSDTHAPRFWKGLPDRVAAELAGVDLVLHGGDVCTPSVLDELAAHAPVVAVLGNNDGPDVAAWGDGVPERRELDVDGVAFAMVHDSGPKQGRRARLRRWFPAADVVVFGHSHIPWDDTDPTTGFRVLNPGSPTDKRRQPHGTMLLLEVAGGVLADVRLVEVS